MKNFILALLCIFSITAHGQLSDGTIAPDFTLTDWYGETHNLYSYLDAGKVVFVEIFAVHCPGCWSYHQTDRLKNMYNMYGPEGTDEIMVLALEHDEYNDEDEWIGIGEPWVAQGNWLEGTPYPQFNVEWPDRGVFEDYNVTFYPVIYKICPDRTLEGVNTSTLEDELYEKVQACAPLSIKEETQTWSVFFNQDSRSVSVTHPEELKSLNVINLQGQTVKALESISNSSVDVSDLANGIYLFEFKTETESIVAKLNVY